jgi:hypothetical protein
MHMPHAWISGGKKQSLAGENDPLEVWIQHQRACHQFPEYRCEARQPLGIFAKEGERNYHEIRNRPVPNRMQTVRQCPLNRAYRLSAKVESGIPKKLPCPEAAHYYPAGVP